MKNRKPIILATILAIATVLLFILSRDMNPPRQIDSERMNLIQQAIETYIAQNGQAPESLTDLPLSPDTLLDHSGHPIHYVTVGTTVRLVSHGGDQLPGGKAFKADYEHTFEIEPTP
jgi:hypothetical protein